MFTPLAFLYKVVRGGIGIWLYANQYIILYFVVIGLMLFLAWILYETIREYFYPTPWDYEDYGAGMATGVNCVSSGGNF